MKYIDKGERGYMKYRKLKLGIGSLAGFLLVAVIYFIGYFIFGTPKNYVTILAVIVVLPTVKIFVQYLMLPWHCNADKAEYERISREVLPLKLYCELLITAKEKNFEILYMLIDRNDNIIAYTNKAKVECDVFETGVTNFLNYYDFNAKVKLYTDQKQFEKRAKQLSNANFGLSEAEKEHISYVFSKISIMSI